MRPIVLPFVLAALAGCTVPPASTDTTEPWQARTLERETELGLARSVEADGGWSYQLPSDLITEGERTVGGVTWRYDGQASFSPDPKPAGPELVWEEAVPDLPGLIEGAVSVDEYGRRWVAEPTDEATLADQIAEYDAWVEATVGLEPFDATEDASRDEDAPSEGEWAVWEPQNWTRVDCDSDGKIDIHRWHTDDRVPVPNPETPRQQKVLMFNGPTGSCSGTMVDDNWMLTAAHCVTDGSGNAFVPSGFLACTRGNAQAGTTCHTVDQVTVSPRWRGRGAVHDYAVLRLSRPPGVGAMLISQASNSTIVAANGFHTGYPGSLFGCAANNPTPVLTVSGASDGIYSTGDVYSAAGRKIRTRIDTGAGESGGPFFYYPSGCCSSEFLTGVLSGYTRSAVPHTGGPKGSTIRSWVIANTP